jgi:hypothetical protein
VKVIVFDGGFGTCHEIEHRESIQLTTLSVEVGIKPGLIQPNEARRNWGSGLNGVQDGSALIDQRLNHSTIPLADLIQRLPLSNIRIDWRKGHGPTIPA